jgi:phosphopantothenoylcysteine decarboxylase/phosphopantothenate--cysteine ligase
MRILVTAGPTCEDLDPVRYLTNRSSGRMGYAIATEAARREHDVILVSGPTALQPPAGVRFVSVRSAADMLEVCLKEFGQCDAAILVAAVADYRPAEYSAEKIKKEDGDLVLRLARTEDIAERLGAIKGPRVLVGFALESGEGHENALRKLESKNLDAIVLNHPDTFGAEAIRAEILVRGESWGEPSRLSKPGLAALVLDFVEKRVRAARQD